MAFIFNGVDKIITFDVSTTSLDVRTLWSRYMDWLAISTNSGYALAMRNVGGDPLPGGKELGITYFLLNGWKIKPFEENQVLTVNGNLYSQDGSSPFAPTIGAFNVSIISTVSNLIEVVTTGSGGTGLTKEEIRIELDTNSVKLKELHQLSGLDSNNPVVITPKKTTTGNIDLNISGNGETLSVITRQ